MLNTPFRLFSRSRLGNPAALKWGCVSPTILKFTSRSQGEAVAARYRKLHPGQEFEIHEVDAQGYCIVDLLK
jgi:hypothetical protein